MVKKIVNIFNSLYFEFQKRRIKKSIISLFFTVLAFFSRSIFIVFVICILLAIFFGLIGLKKKQKLSLITIIISIILIIITLFNYITRDKEAVDPNKGKNILIGKWEYNNSGGFYSFEENKSYVQYVTNETDDNFCYGTYEYEYGYETKNGKLIRQDIDYTYYLLILKPKKCIINSKEDKTDESKKEKTMVFGYGKLDKEKSLIINTITDNYYIVKKIKE